MVPPAQRKTSMMKLKLLAAAMLACSLAAAASPEPDIHWPDGFAPQQADLFDHSELAIAAPCTAVWQSLVDAPHWPAWYPNSENVRLSQGSELAAGRGFRWRTFALEVPSHVHEFEPQQRLGWFGHAKELDAYHTWLLQPQGQGCLVVTEEVVRGPAAVALRREQPQAMHQGHALWLERLAQEAVRRSQP
ncbi:hypothetical protein GM658_26965 [Pseudoduganella eburnea]|uniref:SRPBCC domain-containing protein n=2 Tax=Massilia eburnea TaxID=1776165 RepID=A0A6L6QPG4_9BURK|nr:hypothetical protein [Massilia eburnea]